MKSIKHIILFLSVIFLASCEKEDKAITLPPPGLSQQMQVVIGANYDNQVYIDLENGGQVTRNVNAYDLTFEASTYGFHVYLNGGKLMKATATNNWNFITADSSNAIWNVDNDKLDADSTAIGNWWISAAANNNASQVYIIDRGPQFPAASRYMKFQILNFSPTMYQIKFGKYNNTGITVMDILKDPAYSLSYLSFDNGGKQIEQAPPSNQWDFVFTRYTHVFFDEPVGSIYRNYTVTGALTNIWSGTQGAKLHKDSSVVYWKYEDCNYSNMAYCPLSNAANVIGYSWKFYDFNNSQYTMVPDLFYVIKTSNGLMYKLRMVDFYDQAGNKGTVTMEYQRL